MLGFVGWDAWSHSRHLLELDASYGVTVDAPPVDSRSPTGYADKRRSLVLPARGADTLHWIAQTQQMFETGEWRVRHVDYDNAPAGRDVHWASPFRWWLGLLAWLDHGITGRSLGIAVERATLTAGPAMLAVFLLSLAPFLSRAFSPVAAAITALGAISAYPFYTDFIPGRADHHGIANICALLTVMFLVKGSFGQPQRWFAASAIAGGAGLWISAATQVPVLGAIGLAALVATRVARRRQPMPAWIEKPDVFRTWGLVGTGTSLLAYAIEYLPAHFALRLEVNHPLYALAWAGAGEVLRALLLRARSGQIARRDLVSGVAGATLIAILPLTVWVTRPGSFVVSDPFLWRLHDGYISEFQGLSWHLGQQGFGWGTLAMGLPLLLPILAIALLRGRELPAAHAAAWVLSTIPAIIGCLLGWWQVRWLGMAFALSVPMLATVFHVATQRNIAILWGAACVLAFAPGAALAIKRTTETAETTTEEIRGLAERDVAHWLRLREGPERLVVASSPTTTTRLIAHGSAAGLGTLYWENVDGLKRAAELFGTESPAAAHQLVQRHGVTHIVFITWNAFEGTLAKLYRGLPDSAPIPTDSFLAQLLGAPIPPSWLRALPFKLPDHPALADQQVLIWEVTPEQSPASATANAARYYLEIGRPEHAARLVPGLASFSEDLGAAVMLAAIAAQQRDTTAFSAALARVMALQARGTTLAMEPHIHLVVVLTIAQQLELAREHLATILTRADPRSLRQLTSGTLSDLLALSEALRVDWPSPELKALAMTLLPPARRK